MTHVRDTKVLFDKTSIHATEYSLKFFSFRHQVTVQAINLHPDDEITFEIIHLESGTPDEICGCFIKPGELPSIAGVETLLCFDCDDGTIGEDPRPVRLTANNPVVILNAPQNVILRAKYDGPGIGTSQVWATIETDTQDLLPGQDGCPGACCVHDPDSWREVGPRRCNLETDKLEALMVDNCGVEEWQEIDDLNWQDTGAVRCLPTESPTPNYPTEKQQQNQCGELRWVEDLIIDWADTGSTRCLNHLVQKQQVTVCGELRWVDTTEECGYVATIPLPCGGFAFEEGQQPPSATVEIQGCGETGKAYVYPAPIEGASLQIKEGCIGCDGSEVFGYAVNDGPEGCCTSFVWRETGQIKCLPINPNTGKYTVRRQEIDECGNLRWVDEPEQQEQRDATPTGIIICPFDDADSYTIYREVVSICGEKELLGQTVSGEIAWSDTGVVQCNQGNLPVAESNLTYTYSKQQVNLCGRMRWVPATGTVQVTGNIKCGKPTGSTGRYDIQVEYTDRCGNTVWLLRPWAASGEAAKQVVQVTNPYALCGTINSTTRQYIAQPLVTNLCGEEWIEPLLGQELPAVETGNTRCLGGDADVYTYQIELKSMCGNTLWVDEPLPVGEPYWKPTGALLCGTIQSDGTYSVQVQEVNFCGHNRWVAEIGTRTATETGNARCLDGDADVYVHEVEVKDACGNTAWIVKPLPAGEPYWKPTGALLCGTIQSDGTYSVQVQEVNFCGHNRWVAEVGTRTATETGNMRCSSLNNPVNYNVSKEVRDICGNSAWISDGVLPWADTGRERCNSSHLLERQQITICGQTRWHETTEECGYLATVPMPDGGKGFAPGSQPPSATAQLADCDENVIAYLYPTPVEGATTPVTVGCDACSSGTSIVGYAVDTCEKVFC